jgi:hypothetical protein
MSENHLERDGSFDLLEIDPFRFYRRLDVRENGSVEESLCCKGFIAVIQTSQLLDFDDLSDARHLPRKGTLFVEPQ